MNVKPMKKILLVEDNSGDARLLREMFNEQGPHDTEFTHVESMSAAEKHVAEHAVDLILLDLGLPDAQGLGAVRRAHAAAPHVPLVVLTGLDDESLALQALQEGAQDYLVKGQIETRGLLRALRYAIGRKIMADGLSVDKKHQPYINNIMTEFHDTEDKLRQAQKMEAVGQLTGGVAHDFNNLLTVILGNVELARETVGLDTDVSSLLEAAQRAAQRGGELTGRLLAFSRRQTLLPQRVDVNRLVDEIVKLLQRTLGAAITIETKRGSTPTFAIVDPGQLENALLNLGVNARDAMPSGGTLTIAIGQIALDDVHARSYQEIAPGDYVTITVSDDGTGMTEEVKARAIEPFFTTKDVGKGSGLGLSMVYGFVKQSGGHLTIYSEGGQGTTIRLYLPVHADEKAVLQQQPIPVPEALGKGQVVLVVEDDVDVRTIVVAMLEKLGFSVVSASDGHAALIELGRNPAFDLMITDIVMPRGMSGIQLAKDTHAKWPRMPIIFVSGYSEDNKAVADVVLAGGAFLSKPFSRVQLSNAIHAAKGVRPGVAQFPDASGRALNGNARDPAFPGAREAAFPAADRHNG